MGKTKIKLNFPNGSNVSPWVELSTLRPSFDPKSVDSGKVYASCMAVADWPAFLDLQKRLENGEEHTADKKGDGDVPITNVESSAFEINQAADENVPMTDVDKSAVVPNQIAEELNAMSVVEIVSDVFVAVLEVAPQAIDGNDNYEVEKLRAKRLRLYKKTSPVVKKTTLKTDLEDPWVKRLIKVIPHCEPIDRGFLTRIIGTSRPGRGPDNCR
jgi:hypothetical protein